MKQFFFGRRFVNWKPTQKPGKSKIDKVPVDEGGKPVNAQDPDNWRRYEDCEATGLPVGIVLNGDGYFCFDLDGVRDPATGHCSDVANEILSMLTGAAVEVSQSGEGLHIFGRCDLQKLEDHRQKFYYKNLRCECYTNSRFIAFGGGPIEGDPETDHTSALLQLIPGRRETVCDELPDGRDPAWIGPVDDVELVQRMLRPSSDPNIVLGHSVSVPDLWYKDEDKLKEFFPNEKGDGFDHSSADFALLTKLAFWTGRDAKRMERLFGMSELGKRAKWQKRADYRSRSIKSARVKPATVYNQNHFKEKHGASSANDIPLPTTVIMDLENFLDLMVFATAKQQFVHRGTKKTIQGFRNAKHMYSASRYYDEASKKWRQHIDAWIAHPDRISVDTLTWHPGGPEFCPAPDLPNATAYNIWSGIRPMTPPEDWQERCKPFLDHLVYLIPDQTERNRFLQWLAHIIQEPGELPHTCYLMYTETQGIGRNWIGAVLSEVIKGYVALGIPLDKILDNDFNGSIAQKLLAIVDEVREGNSQQKYKRGEALKRVITENYRLINPKYEGERIELNCCRWLLLSNHADALPFEQNDRRIIVIKNPDTPKDQSYFANLYAKAKQPKFIASVYELLRTYDISTFNAGDRALMNEAKLEALHSMASETDKLVKEFAEEWPGDICGRRDIKRYVANELGPVDINEAALTHAIRRAGLISTGVRVNRGSSKDRVIIVRNVTVEAVKNAIPFDVSAKLYRLAEDFEQGRAPGRPVSPQV
ncbi:MAG: DUF5906 domain-containing protein [Pseudomonadota bacterium]